MTTIDERAYRALRDGAAVFAPVGGDFIVAAGRDRLSFLQGQVSNDVASLQPGDLRHACLLNNTGHMLADLRLVEMGDSTLIQTDSGQASSVIATLERYVIRERVTLTDRSAELGAVTIQGARAAELLGVAGIPDLGGRQAAWSEGGDDERTMTARRDRTGEGGYDIVCPVHLVDDILAALRYSEFAIAIDAAALEIARIEAQIPRWGAELTEAVIPLEALIDDAISYTKGCYVGQEIIARVHARGHVNKQLRLIRFGALVEPGADIVARSGTRDGQRVGRVTSAVESPRLGPIALGYIHVDCAAAGTPVESGGIAGVVGPLPGRAE